MATTRKEPATKTKKAEVNVIESDSSGKEKKGAASKPTTKKTTADATVSKASASVRVSSKATEKRTAVAKSKVAGDAKKLAKPTPEERYRMVETAAYFIAERSGFQGDSAAHWAAAELEIAALLKKGNA